MQSKGSQRVDTTEWLNWTEIRNSLLKNSFYLVLHGWRQHHNLFSSQTFVEKKIASTVRGSENQNCKGWTTIWLLAFHSALSLGFPDGSAVKESACNAGDTGCILESGIVSRVGSGNPFQYSWLKYPTDREAWQATVQRARHNLVTMRACYRNGILP